jgi:hypothetical protein
MAATATQDLSKLPRWARERIQFLERRVQEAADREAMGPEDSNTFLNPHLDHDSVRRPTPLGRDAHVRWHLEGDEERFYLEARLDDGVLLVMSSHLLAVRPKSSNVINVELVRSYV